MQSKLHQSSRSKGLLYLLAVLLPFFGFAQVDSSSRVILVPSEKSLASINNKYTKLTARIDKQSEKLLKSMQHKEEKIRGKLALKDSTKAAGLFSNSASSYQQLQDKLKSPIDKTVAHPLKEYVSDLDSLGTAMNFLKKVPGLSPEKLQQVTKTSEQLQSLETQLQKASEIKDFVKQREQLLSEQLANTSLSGELKGISKEVYYYKERLNAYKELISDRKKLEERTIAAIREIPAFKTFFQKNSYLAQLFPVPAGYGTLLALDGLQARAQVQDLLTQRINAPGNIDPGQYLQGQLQAGQTQLSQLQDKAKQAGDSGDDMDMPNFKPNNLRTKKLFQRLEYNLNFQTSGTTNYLPAAFDIAALAGFKLSDKLSFGGGLSYRVGLGRGWNHIALSNQGAGIRTYVSAKIKGSIWFSGGFEWQYMKEFENFRQIKDISLWNHSALAGIEKRYKIGKKREGKMQLLFDAIASRQTPQAQAFKFRIGYSL